MDSHPVSQPDRQVEQEHELQDAPQPVTGAAGSRSRGAEELEPSLGNSCFNRTLESARQFGRADDQGRDAGGAIPDGRRHAGARDQGDALARDRALRSDADAVLSAAEYRGQRAPLDARQPQQSAGLDGSGGGLRRHVRRSLEASIGAVLTVGWSVWVMAAPAW